MALCFAPQTFSEPIRTNVRDATRPGQYLARSAVDWIGTLLARSRHPTFHSDELAALRAQVEQWKLRHRRLQIKAALLGEQMRDTDQHGKSPYRATISEPLVVPELLQALVLGKETAALWRAGRFIDKGIADGLFGSALVLKNATPVIDQGRNALLEIGQPVYSGRCVVGRLAHVGRFISTVQPITNRNYRGLAQLVRETDHGIVFGAEGIIQGEDQQLCRLKFISSTEPVAVGDDVYTGNRSSTLPYPMYYGKVVQAELRTGAPHWEIRVKPAVDQSTLQTVHVLRSKLNPTRMLGQ